MEVSGALLPEKENFSSSLTPHSSTSNQQQQQLEKLSRPLAFDKMEALVKEMQDVECGVPVRSQKLFLTSIPSAFMGYDLIEWLMERLSIEESEALNIANQLCLHGYFFPVSDCKILVVKDDSSLYRFQTPYYWPVQHKTPDNIEYAIYLVKRSLRNKQRHGLEEYEADALASLHKNLKGKWEFITMQAEEQVRISKERKKGDKIVTDSQERAFWRVYRPPPSQFTPLEPCPVPSRDRQGKPRKRTVEDCQREVEYLKTSLGRIRMKMSQACESLSSYWETFADYDCFLNPALPSNPWVSDDLAFWQLNGSFVENPTEKRVKRWSISIEELVIDPTGLHEFTAYLKKEYSHENIRFWIAVNELRRSSQSQIARTVKEIYEEFLKPGAPCEINIDGKTMENVQQGLSSPSRFTFDSAAEHIYALLLKKDCYPRFIRSEHYRSLLATGIQPSHKKRFFGFGGATKKKSTTTAPSSSATQALTSMTTPSQSNLSRRRGSDRSLSGSAHELAICGVKNVTDFVPHSHSQNNLCDIPYSRDVSKGPTANTELPVPSTSAVCPWGSNDFPETSKVSVSICPWEDEVPSTSGQAKRRSSQNSCIESRSSSSDISDISERLRKSCGVRQNTLDPDMFSSQRLAPTNSQQRRASITILSPRSSSECKQAEQTTGCQINVNTITPDKIESVKFSSKTMLVECTTSESQLDISDSTKESPENSESSIIIVNQERSQPDEPIEIKDNSTSFTDSVNKELLEKCNKIDVIQSDLLPDSSASLPNMPVIKVIQPKVETGSICVENLDEYCSTSIDISESLSELKDSTPSNNSEIVEQQPATRNEAAIQKQVDDEMLMENVGQNLTPGCVAPAPTPVPTLAPLAEDEIYSVDEDRCSIKEGTSSEQSDTLKQPTIESDVGNEDKGGKPGEESAERNTVCPWEDDDGDASANGAYVKTYSTLGYL